MTVALWPSTVTQLQAWAWKPIITVAVIHIICCSPESVFLSVFVTLPQLVDVQANVESPLLFERSCRRLSLTAYSSVSRPPDPHRARRPGCKRSRSSLYVAEMNSWQRSEPLGSAVRCQSQRGGKEHLPEWLSAGGRWMRWESRFITAATQSKTLRFVLTVKSSMCEHLHQQFCIESWRLMTNLWWLWWVADGVFYNPSIHGLTFLR